jgi:hypothetical protein
MLRGTRRGAPAAAAAGAFEPWSAEQRDEFRANPLFVREEFLGPMARLCSTFMETKLIKAFKEALGLDGGRIRSLNSKGGVPANHEKANAAEQEVFETQMAAQALARVLAKAAAKAAAAAAAQGTGAEAGVVAGGRGRGRGRGQGGRGRGRGRVAGAGEAGAGGSAAGEV